MEKFSIKRVKNSQEIQPVFSRCDAKTWALFDVDDTLITPKDVFFRALYGKNPYKNFFDEYKKEVGSGKISTEQRAEFERIVSTFRMQHESMLTEKDWPKILYTLRKQGSYVFALTMMDTGPFGKISSMEEWRYQRLHDLGLAFTPILPGHTDYKVLGTPASRLQSTQQGTGVFYKGIMMTGRVGKGATLEQALRYSSHKPSFILFVDDREEMVEDVGHLCKRLGVDYTGIIYEGASEVPGKPVESIVACQKHELIHNDRWLSDAQAQKLLKEKAN